MDGLLVLICSVLALVIGSLVIGSLESLALWRIALSSLEFPSLYPMLSKSLERILSKALERMLGKLLEWMLIKSLQRIWMLLQSLQRMLSNLLERMLIQSLEWMLIIGGGEQGRGNGYDDDNDGGCMVGSVEIGRRQRERRAKIFLPAIIQSILIIMSLDDFQLSTTRRVIQYFSMISNLVGFICFAAVLWLPYTDLRVARILNPRISGILSGIGSAFAVVGAISIMGISLPL